MALDKIKIPDIDVIGKTAANLGELKEAATKSTLNLFNGVERLYTAEIKKANEKGAINYLQEKFFGGAILIMSLMASLKTVDETKESQVSEELTELQQQVSQIPEALAKTIASQAKPIDYRGTQPLEVSTQSTAGDRAIKAAGEVLTECVLGENCWEWIERIYKKGKLGRDTVFNKHKTNEEKDFATLDILAKIKPGDHLYLRNQNKFDTYGNHSVIFFGWEGSPSNMKARVASSWNQAKVPDIAIANVNPADFKLGNKKESSTPVTYIAHPV